MAIATKRLPEVPGTAHMHSVLFRLLRAHDAFIFLKPTIIDIAKEIIFNDQRSLEVNKTFLE